MEVFSFIVNLLSLAVISWACVYVAGQKKRNKGLAGVMGVLFGCIALCVYLTLDENTKTEVKNNDKQLLND